MDIWNSYIYNLHKFHDSSASNLAARISASVSKSIWINQIIIRFLIYLILDSIAWKHRRKLNLLMTPLILRRFITTTLKSFIISQGHTDWCLTICYSFTFSVESDKCDEKKQIWIKEKNSFALGLITSYVFEFTVTLMLKFLPYKLTRHLLVSLKFFIPLWKSWDAFLSTASFIKNRRLWDEK